MRKCTQTQAHTKNHHCNLTPIRFDRGLDAQAQTKWAGIAKSRIMAHEMQGLGLVEAVGKIVNSQIILDN